MARFFKATENSCFFCKKIDAEYVINVDIKSNSFDEVST